TAERFAREIAGVIGDPAVDISYDAPSTDAPARPARGPLWDAISAATESSAPGVPMGPFMAAWTTDSQPLRALGVEMVGIDPPPSEYCAHSKDERIPLAGLDWYAGLLWDVTLRLAGPAPVSGAQKPGGLKQGSGR